MPKNNSKKESAPTPQTERTSVLVGNKSPMNYVLFTANQLRDVKEITFKARGNSISKAVDVVEILRRRFMTNLKIKSIELGTAEVEDKQTKKLRRVSTIEITITV